MLQVDFVGREEEVDREDFERHSPDPIEWTAAGLKLGHLVGKNIQVVVRLRPLLMLMPRFADCVVQDR